jgi:hypothetical protein
MIYNQLSAASTGHMLQMIYTRGAHRAFPPTTLVVSNHHYNTYLLRLITLNEHYILRSEAMLKICTTQAY